MTRYSFAKNGTCLSQSRLLEPSPWISKSGGPSPVTSKYSCTSAVSNIGIAYTLINYLDIQIYIDHTSGKSQNNVAVKSLHLTGSHFILTVSSAH
jgi:hypothetical protein